MIGYKHTVLFIYVCQLALALVVAIKWGELINNSLAKVAVSNKLIDGYNHSLVADFRRVFATDLSSIQSIFVWILIIYLIFSIFLNGGLIGNLVTRCDNLSGFLKSGLKNFAAFFLIFILSMISILIAAAITLFLWPGLPNALFEARYSEPTIFVILLITGIAFTVFYFLIFSWSVLTRMSYAQGRGSLLSCMKDAILRIWCDKLRTLGLLVFFVFLQGLLIAIYLSVEKWFGMRTAFLIIIFFILQQAFVLVRIYWRGALYLSLNRFFNHRYSPIAPSSIPSE